MKFLLVAFQLMYFITIVYSNEDTQEQQAPDESKCMERSLLVKLISVLRDRLSLSDIYPKKQKSKKIMYKKVVHNKPNVVAKLRVNSESDFDLRDLFLNDRESSSEDMSSGDLSIEVMDKSQTKEKTKINKKENSSLKRALGYQEQITLEGKKDYFQPSLFRPFVAVLRGGGAQFSDELPFGV